MSMDNDNDAPSEYPKYKGGPTLSPIESIPSIDDHDLDNFVKRLNFIQGICHSVEVIEGRWIDEDGLDARTSGKYSIPSKLMDIVTSLGFSNMGAITDADDRTLPDYPVTAVGMADALYLICNLCSANGWMIGDILKERIKGILAGENNALFDHPTD